METWLTAAGGRLVGRPDKVHDDAVIDYKTGNIYEDGESDIIRASYVRQLQLYACLVGENTGRWPVRGILLPMEGSPVEVRLDADECHQIAAEALHLLDSYNASVNAQVSAVDLASPSPEACRWCSYQLVCPAFWAASDNSWTEQNNIVSLGGVATCAPQSIHSGSALSMSVQVDEGTAPLEVVTLAPLAGKTHTALQLIQEGTRVRTVDLYQRVDGTLSPGRRTVIARFLTTYRLS